MKKVVVLILSAVTFFVAHSQQQTILLFTEDFDNGGTSFIFDNPGPAGLNFGNNDWIINDLYNGQPTYLNTPNEDNTTGGLIINNAPTSNYLHIYDVTTANATGIANDNWNPLNPSDRFCYIGNSFCTLGMTNFQFTFDWICEGNSGAYGQVYYRSGVGAWIQIGQPKYYNQSEWAYESIEDTALLNQANIQIGFRWVDPGIGGATNVAFGLDDVFAVGTFNSADTNNAVTLTTNLDNTQICQGDPVTFGLTLNTPLCDGSYEVEMSGANGNFDNPYNLGVFDAGPSFTSADGIMSLPTDASLLGNCFKIRVVRISPPPLVTSDTSICFSIIQCPNSIFNVSAAVLNDADTTCILSEIDVNFNSIGVFFAGNVYYAELSDTNGSFVDSTALGNLPSRDSFPPPGPGDISGLIPASVPPGCGYYIRVRSTKPPTLSAPIGPFCLKQCDALTNNITDLHFCVASGPYPSCDSINITDDYWNKQAKYDTCNNWVVQLRSMMDFSLVNSGGLAIYHNNMSGNFELCMPANAGLLPVAPGSYYMRIVSTCSNQPWDSTGTVIRITIGAPSVNASVISIFPDTICIGGTGGGPVDFFVSPFNSPPSNYQWTSSLINGGVPFIWPFAGFGINLLPFTPLGTYVTNVQEINFGCYGPLSAPAYLTVIGSQPAVITGPAVVCRGDTDQYNVTFLNETYYAWNIPPGVQLLSESNVETTLAFDSLGIFSLSYFALNACATDTGTLQIKVVPSTFKLNTGPDTAICIGDSVVVNANAGENKTFLVQDTGVLGKQGGMFNLVAHSALTVDSFAVELQTRPLSLKAEVYGKPGSYLGFEQKPAAWNLIGKNYNNATALEGQFTTISVPVNRFMPAGDTFAFYVTTLNVPAVEIDYGSGNGPQGTVYSSDGNIDFIQGTVLDYAFTNNLTGYGYILNVIVYYSTNTGFIYTWSNGDTTAGFQIAPTQNETLSVMVSDHGHCANSDTMHITVSQIPTVYAGPDTAVCPDQPYVMQGVASAPVMWQPSTGLSSATDPHAIFNYNDSVSYVLIATDSLSHCSNKSAVNILVPLKLSVGPDTSICQGNSDTLHAATTGEFVVWSPSLGLNDSTVLNPVFSSITGTGGVFTITATDKSGCKLTGDVKIDVENCTSIIVAPSAFTPTFSGNGTGQPDNYFILWGNNIQEYEVRIYNRWGELVYYSGMLGELNGNYSPPLWDGKFKGKLQDTGTFVYYIKATDLNGKSVDKKGNLTLIR